MTFAYTLTRIANEGNVKVSSGTYTSTDAGAGGDINTGLTVCEFMKLQPTGSAVSASAPSVNETLPAPGDAITIVTIANEVGVWRAFGW